ncbi:MAG: RagB/SusD family nutrient uptake outer membrane protein, partial [Ferruginibacter sp.]|nr:RagB/SusD family nutrient uptake outer membrane protein [Cytophagales bacterium]
KQFSLLPDYRAVFETKNSAESIFEVQFDAVNSNSLSFFFYPTNLGGRNEVGPRGIGSNLEAAYEAGDRRKNASISPRVVVDGRTIPEGIGIKYYRPGTGEDNVRVIRLAEMYLTGAEALAQLDNIPGSLALLNEVRQRAGLPAILAAGVADKSALLDRIANERRVELAMEGHRWFDLIRTGKAQSVLGITDPNKLLFPIPQRETINNPVIGQNPGY